MAEYVSVMPVLFPFLSRHSVSGDGKTTARLQIGTRKFGVIGGRFGSVRNHGADVVSLRKRRVDPRNRMYGDQVEVGAA